VKATVVLLVGSGILYCLWHTPLVVRRQWLEWIVVNVVALFIIPVLMIVSFMDEGLREFGLRLGDTRRSWRWISAILLVLLPVLIVASRDASFQEFYPRYPPARYSVGGFLVLLVTIGIYMFCWEWFFRGFMLFGMAPAFGRAAIIAQAIPFGLSHWGNPTPEVIGSFIAGLALGELAWRFLSFVPCFILHWAAYIIFNLLVVLQSG